MAAVTFPENTKTICEYLTHKAKTAFPKCQPTVQYKAKGRGGAEFRMEFGVESGISNKYTDDFAEELKRVLGGGELESVSCGKIKEKFYCTITGNHERLFEAIKIHDPENLPHAEIIKQFSPQWWNNRTESLRWCNEFCTPFYDEDPSLLHNPETHASVGVVFFNKPDGSIIPAGFTALQEGNFVFQYHPSYLADTDSPALSESLPKRPERFESKGKLLPLFDNLPAEGWFGKAQGTALGIDPQKIDGDSEPIANRYNRLMMFSRECPGAAWATYIKIDPEIAAEQHQETVAAALRSRSTISGVQPKLLGVMKNGQLSPANYWETSTHIVKLPAKLPKLIEYEYMSGLV